MAGLFHDVGQVGIAALLRDDAFAFKKLSLTAHDELEQVETKLVGFAHSELSEAINTHNHVGSFSRFDKTSDSEV